MNTKLKASIEQAIQSALDLNCEEDMWEKYLHPQLVRQMTEAAESVFDAAQDAQTYFEQEQG